MGEHTDMATYACLHSYEGMWAESNSVWRQFKIRALILKCCIDSCMIQLSYVSGVSFFRLSFWILLGRLLKAEWRTSCELDLREFHPFISTDGECGI